MKPGTCADFYQIKFACKFEELVTTADSRHTGKIDWSAVEFFYWNGYDVEEAAKNYVETRKNDSI